MERRENRENESEDREGGEPNLDGVWFRRYPSSMPPPPSQAPPDDLDEDDPLSRDWFVP